MIGFKEKEENCRVCKSRLTNLFADLGVTPIANDLVPQATKDRQEKRYPLRALICNLCHLVQLDYTHPSNELFTDEYPYYSSFSSSWTAHSKDYVENIVGRLRLTEQSNVIEIASNDGYLLQYFKPYGVQTLGVEPCKNVAEAARRHHGIETIEQFFSHELGAELAAAGKKADLIIANNVLAHVPDPVDLMRGVHALLKDSGIVTIEFPHLLELVRNNQFDTIYHEHYFYYSLRSFASVLERAGLRMVDCETLSTHGGSLRVFACKEQSDLKPTASLLKKQQEEIDFGLYQVSTFETFRDSMHSVKAELREFLIEQRNNEKRVVAYGAPAKGNTLLNYCGITTDLIEFTVDLNPQKQGNLLPGSRLPVLPVEAIFSSQPDYIVVLPWNLSEEIVSQLETVKNWGAKFVVPIPQLRVIG